MSYLLDTNILSELRRKRPDGKVLKWLENRPTVGLFVSTLTLGEIRKGIELLPDGARRRSFLAWLETDLPRWFKGRILPVDHQVADCWGRLAARAPRPLPPIDSLLAATALTHGISMVTRNEPDFRHPGLDVVNPWND